MDALRFCGSDRGGPRQAVCIHRYARVRASKSKEGAKPVVRETSLPPSTHDLLTYLPTCIHRAVEPSSCELSLFISRNWREPVVSEMFPTLSVVLTGLLGLWLTPTIAPVLLSSSSSGRGLVVVVVVVVV